MKSIEGGYIMYNKKRSKEQLRRYYARIAAFSKSDMEYHNTQIYYHMKLQAEGVKYKPRSSDKTYHGRKAIHALLAYEMCQKNYFDALEELEQLYQ